MKGKRGITLIALVVTIIILIILAGVSINILLVDGGLIDKVEQAKENTEIAANEEREDLDKVANWIEGNTGGGTGSGEEEREPGPIETEPKPDYIPIYTKEDLRKVATGDGTAATEYEIKGIKYDMLPTSKYMLMNNIDLQGYTGSDGCGWEPIQGFLGTFDGNGCAIYNLTMNRPDGENSQALFYTNISGEEQQPKIEITNLALIDANITARESVAGIILAFGAANADVSKCTVKGNLFAKNGWVYGIGYTKGNITNCTVNTTNMESEASLYGIGQANDIRNCKVSSDNMIAKGMIQGIGVAKNNIENCDVYTKKMETNGSGSMIRGIGLADVSITGCNLNADTVISNSTFYGIGQVNNEDAIIENCSFTCKLLQGNSDVNGITVGAGSVIGCNVKIDNVELTGGYSGRFGGIGFVRQNIEECSVTLGNATATSRSLSMYGIGTSDTLIKKCTVEANTISNQSIIFGIGSCSGDIEDCAIRCNLMKIENDTNPIFLIGQPPNGAIRRCSAKINKVQSENMFGISSSSVTLEDSYAIVNDANCENIKLFGSPKSISNSYAIINAKPEGEHTYTSCALKSYTFDTTNNTVTYPNVTNTYTNAPMVYPEGTNTAEEPFIKTLDQLKDKATFTGWDETIWGFDANKNGGFPYLKNGDAEAI